MSRNTKGPAVTAASISRDLRLMASTSLNFVGGVQYLNKIAKTNPSAYLQFIARCLIKDDESNVAGVQVIVQQLVIGSGAQPVPGVWNSPIREQIAPPATPN